MKQIFIRADSKHEAAHNELRLRPPNIPVCGSAGTHPVLWVLEHVGHAASVLLEARQQLAQGDGQQRRGQTVTGRSGEFHAWTVREASALTAAGAPCFRFLLSAACRAATHRPSSQHEPQRATADGQRGRPMGAKLETRSTNRRTDRASRSTWE